MSPRFPSFLILQPPPQYLGGESVRSGQWVVQGHTKVGSGSPQGKVGRAAKPQLAPSGAESPHRGEEVDAER